MNSLINVCEKLKFFREIHKSGERPPYIDICKLKSDISLLSKFWLSAHSLAIEKGCYSNIERQNRVCLSCDTGEVENEYHFFSACPCYISLRKTFLQKVNIKIQASTLTYFSTCPFGQLTKKSTCPTQSFSCPKKLIKITKTRE